MISLQSKRRVPQMALLILVSMASWVRLAPAQVPASAELWKQYNAAIADSAVVERSEVRPLFHLTFDSKTKTTAMVTWTSWDGYKKAFDKHELVPLTQDVWVVSFDELQSALRKFPAKLDEASLNLRLAQLYGLPPDKSNVWFAILSVDEGLAKSNGLFRPALDPSIETDPMPLRDTYGTVFPGWASLDHRLWIANQSLSSYKATMDPVQDRGHVGYPWTHLGYTYNWRPGEDEYGLSEYVIRVGAAIKVQDMKTTKELYDDARKEAAATAPVR